MLLSSFLRAGPAPLDDRWYTPGRVVHMDSSGLMDPEGALRVATVWRAVNVLAAAVATLPIDVFKPIEPMGREPAKDDPWRRKLRLRPNRMQTSYRWRHHMVGHLVLGGNYYARKLGEEQLWPLDPDRTRVGTLNNDGSLEYVYTRLNGGEDVLSQDEVLHIRGFSRDGITGLSVLELMRDTTRLSLASQKQRTTFLQNELRPSVVIKHPGELSAKAETNLLRGYKRAFGGVSNAGEPMVIAENGDIVPFGVTSRDSQYIEGQGFLVGEFLRFIGVPGVLVGFSDNTTTYASAEQFVQSFLTYGVAPLTTNIETELTSSLYWDHEDELFVKININAMLRADSAARSAFYRALIELGVLTRNEVRELEDRNPLDGLDEPLTPMNMGTGGKPDAPPPQPEPPKPPRKAEEIALARAHAVTMAAAERIVRKEVFAIAGGQGKKGAAERYAADAEGWRAWVVEFYSRHVEVVVSSLLLERAQAERYCVAHRDQVLSGGLAAVEGWGGEEIARLAALAFDAGPSGPPIVFSAVVTNRFDAPPPANVSVTPPPVSVTTPAVHVPITVQSAPQPPPRRVKRTAKKDPKTGTWTVEDQEE